MTGSDWSWAQRVGFRFVFVFAVLSAAPFPLDLISSYDPVTGPWNAFVNGIASWFGAQVFGTGPISIEENGSGDRTVDYLRSLLFVLIAFSASLIWSALSSARDHRRLHEALRIYLRAWLGIMLLLYGLAKVLKTQMPAPSAGRLWQPYGSSSPMGLLWTFMGFSTPYTVFAGLMEVIPGLFLFFRRTALLGALLTLGVMGNVVLLNFCYDVPVKLFSTTLFLVALLLAAPHLRRLFQAIVLGRASPPSPPPPALAGPRWQRIGRIAFAIAILVGAGEITRRAWTEYHTAGDGRPVEADSLFHPYDIVEKSDHPANAQWIRVGIGRKGIAVRDGEVLHQFENAWSIEGPSVLDLHATTDVTHRRVAVLTLWREGPHVILVGIWEGAPLRLVLRPYDRSQFLLLSRGFHFINETPFNR